MNAEDKIKKKKAYIAKFKRLYKDISGAKVDDMIDRLAMMATTIDDCEEHITEEGLVTEMCQGKYSIERENPYVKILQNSTKTYQSLIRQLDDMMPTKTEQSNARAGETFAALVAKGRDYELS